MSSNHCANCGKAFHFCECPDGWQSQESKDADDAEQDDG